MLKALQFRSILLLAVIVSSCFAGVYYVSQEKVEGTIRTGSWERPFQTIKDCVNKLSDPGDECQIRNGIYHEEISINDLHGTPEKPIMIRGYENERPVLDGTIEIKPETEWVKENYGNIYRTKFSTKIWQLFVDDTMMTNARWPNAKWSDKSLFNGSLWATISSSSKKGLIVNKGNSLAKTQLDMSGAIAVLNVGSFNTFVAKVKEHKAGSNRFSYDDTFGDYHFKASRSRYFLEDKLSLLDAPEEWYYDKKTSMLYVWTPSGESPKNSVLKGKVQSYAMYITKCSHLLIRDIDFFATAIKADSKDSINKVNEITFHSLNFKHHTYSKRMLGELGLIDWMDINGIYDRSRQTWGKFTFFNNTFYGSDGLALSYAGKNVTLENNLFEYNDFTAANMVKAGGGLATIKSVGIYDLFIRNTLRYNGASVGIRPSLIPSVYLNDIKKQCWGVIQNDGAGVQLTTKPQYGSKLKYNWVHDQPKYGLRFDGEPPRVGTYGTISNNVVARCNGLMVKGDHHTVTNNLAIAKQNANDDDKQGSGCALCVLKYVRKNKVAINNSTIVMDNIADVANGGKIIGEKDKTYPIAGSVVKNNLVNKKINRLLMDPLNLDFRPKISKINIGPYPYEKKMKYYWIPGRQLYKASSPVPPDSSITVKASNRDALMWLNAYGCEKHNVFLGIEDRYNKNFHPDNIPFLGSVTNGGNVFYLKDKIRRRTKYYWRVDAVTEDSEGKQIIYKGDTWSFTADYELHCIFGESPKCLQIPD